MAEIKFYRIKHKPTGLFFSPSRYPYSRRLTNRGKVYGRKPTALFNSLNKSGGKIEIGNQRKYNPSNKTLNVENGDFEIVTYKLCEDDTVS